MSPQERQALKALIIATSAYYGQQLADNVIGLYVEDLADLEFGKVVAAVKEIRRDPKTTRFPLPALIRARILPMATSDEDRAVEAATRIAAAVRMYGWTNEDRAKLYVGELGWRVVEIDGGWQNVCETLTQDNLGTYRAQWRQLALATARNARAGRSGPPELPEPVNASELSQIGDVIRLLSKEGA